MDKVFVAAVVVAAVALGSGFASWISGLVRYARDEARAERAAMDTRREMKRLEVRRRFEEARTCELRR